MITTVDYSTDHFDAERPYRLTFNNAGHVKEVLLTSEEFYALQSQMAEAEQAETDAGWDSNDVRWDAARDAHYDRQQAMMRDMGIGA